MRKSLQVLASLLLCLSLLSLVACGGEEAPSSTESVIAPSGGIDISAVPAGAEEITPTHERVITALGTFDAQTGWSGTKNEGGTCNFVHLLLCEGDVLYLCFSEDTVYHAYIAGNPEVLDRTDATFSPDTGSGGYWITAEKDVQVRLFLVRGDAE